MIARTIEFDVTVDGITPQGEQFGGLQGEHKATELLFNISQELAEITAGSFDGDALIITLQCTDGAGGYHEYEIATNDYGTTKKFEIPREITQAGGIASFCLAWSDVVWEDDNDEKAKSKTIIFSFPFKLRFKDTLTVGTPSQQEFLEDGASILEGAKQYTEETRILKEETQTLVENANESLTALEDTTSKAWTYDTQLKRTNKEAQSNIKTLNETIEKAEDAEDSLEAILGNTNTVIEGLNNIEAALDEIIALQEHFIGGGN